MKTISARMSLSSNGGVLDNASSGAVRVPVADTFSLDEVEQAYERFAAGGKLGKVVLLAG